MTTTAKTIYQCAAFARSLGIGSNAVSVSESSPTRSHFLRYDFTH